MTGAIESNGPLHGFFPTLDFDVVAKIRFSRIHDLDLTNSGTSMGAMRQKLQNPTNK